MSTTYQNPFLLPEQWDTNQLGDPFMMRFDGYTYLYCSSNRIGIKCWKSENMTDWIYVGSVCDQPETNGAYAPEVCYFNGKFYMVTSPKGSGHYLLSSDSPEGPFSFISENFGLLIDGSIFVDDDGKEYFLRAGHKGIVVHDMPTCDLPDLNGKTIPQSFLGHWTEGPMIIKRYDHYFLTYTGNHLLSRGYRVDYSVSKTSPTEGYVNLTNNTLLLEVGDEFHALGHSSSVLGPDMDSYYIAYHSFDFCASKPFRSLNIDRLFFNGARMYTNATWWEQDAPLMPIFTSRNGVGISQADKNGLSYWLTPEINGVFTTEICLYPKDKNVHICLGENHHLTIQPDHRFFLRLNKDVLLLQGVIPDTVSMTSHLTVRIAYNDGSVFLWVNGLWVGRCEADFESGSIVIGICAEAGGAPSFLAVSDVSYGSYDLKADKSIPGRFDAVHHTLGTNAETIGFSEKGMDVYGVNCQKDTTLSFAINAKEKGGYVIFARIKGEEPEINFCVNGVQCTAALGNIVDSKGFAFVNCGTVLLEKGKGSLVFSDFSTEVLLDYIEVAAFHEQKVCNVIENGNNVCDDLQIIGHKRNHSMIHKYYGFTCAENHGMAFVGDTGWTNYSILARVHIDPRLDGFLSIFIRATKESWFVGQVKSSLWGYRVKIDNEGVSLCRCHYDEKTLAFVSMDWQGDLPREVDLKIEVYGATITVSVSGQHILLFTDPMQFAYGKVGMEACGEGYGFISFDVNE